jgi:glycosyltransferase involved in cell wall biosynthesis
MKILFTFENPLPSAEADAEVFVTTARHLTGCTSRSWLHVPASDAANCRTVAALAGMPVVRAYAPLVPAALRHIVCGLTLVFRREFRQADLVYTRNLWVASVALLAGQRVVFDHYRPWPAQVPPLGRWIYRLMCHRRFLVNVSHSEYTRAGYVDLGVPREKLYCVRNGFDPQRLGSPIPVEVAKRRVGIEGARKTVVYTGRVNHKKGLDLVIEAARRLPDHLFVLVGSQGNGPIEAAAQTVANVRLVPWQPPEALATYLFAADVLLIPPSLKPLAEFGSTVIPLKLYLYMGSGRPILAGDSPDLREVLEHGRNALLCRPDCLESLVGGISTLTGDAELAQRLAAAALADSHNYTWESRARQIAAIVRERLDSVATARGAWSRQQSRSWLRQSRRWVIHLLRKRSWVLPAVGLEASPDPQPLGQCVGETGKDARGARR